MILKIGETIKALRAKHKVTQEQFAVFLGVTPQAISRWEAGNGYPDIETLPAIADYFEITTDELLGIDRGEKEKRRREIYIEMQKASESGDDNSETVRIARQYAAEFPSDEIIQKNLADCICRANMWEKTPDPDVLAEAEKIYLTLAETTQDSEFRNEVLEVLTALYAVGYKDTFRLEQTLRQLPTMKYCRESVAASMAEMTNGDVYPIQDYIEKLTDGLGLTLTHYIAYTLPNGPETWDEKITMLENVYSLYRFVFGDDMLFYHNRAGYICRVIATYKIAQEKYDDALTELEKMCYHAEESDKVKAGDRFTSPFVDKIEYPAEVAPFGAFQANISHNDAWYIMHNKLTQDRYDPLRNSVRFKAIIERLSAIGR